MTNTNKGFGSMDKEHVKDIAKKGGEARKEQLGPEGYSEMGRKGGEARKEQIGPGGYAEMGHKGVEAKKQHQEHGKSSDQSYGSTSQNDEIEGE